MLGTSVDARVEAGVDTDTFRRVAATGTKFTLLEEVDFAQSAITPTRAIATAFAQYPFAVCPSPPPSIFGSDIRFWTNVSP